MPGDQTMHPVIRTLPIAFLLGLSAAANGQAPWFAGVGQIPDSSQPGSRVYGLAGNGSRAVGYATNDSGVFEAVYWSLSGGLVSLVSEPGAQPWGIGYAASADGAVLVGTQRNTPLSVPFRWDDANGVVELLGFPAGSINPDGRACSADGSVIVGYFILGGVTQGFHRSSAGTVTPLGFASQTVFFSRATGVSADGTIVCGYAAANAGDIGFRWTSGTGMVSIGDLTGGSLNTNANAISADGSTIVGRASGSAGTEAFRWQNDVMTGLGDLPGGSFFSNALAVSADGSTVVGLSVVEEFASAAFVWTEGDGLRSVSTVLEALGVDLTGWSLDSATAVSYDGLTIAGWGFHNGVLEGWVAYLGADCAADFDDNGDVEVPDIFAYLSAWFAQDPSADIDGIPGVAVPDIFQFLALWFAGC